MKVMSAGETAVPGPLMVNSTHVSGCRGHRVSVQLSAPPPQEQENTLPFSSCDSSSVGMRDEELQFVAETTCARRRCRGRCQCRCRAKLALAVVSFSCRFGKERKRAVMDVMRERIGESNPSFFSLSFQSKKKDKKKTPAAAER